MPDRWLRACRRLVPEPFRSSSFDPTVADLQRDWLLRPGASWQRRIAIALVALECRRLAARATLGRLAHACIPESRSAMVWSTVSRACRVFVRQPGLSAVVVLTLAVGIGANLTVFGIVNQFLLAPLPVPEPDQLVRVSGVTAETDADVMSYPVYRDLRDGMRGLDLAAHAQPTARVGPEDAGQFLTVELVTGNYFRVMDLVPLRGRLIEERDDRVAGANPVVVIGASYWRGRYGRSESVIGQTLMINSTPFEIIGVAPDGFHGTYNARQVDVWAPMMMYEQVRPRGTSIERRGWGWLSTIGRLRPGATLAAAQQDVEGVAADLNKRFPPRSPSGDDALKFVVRHASPMSADDQKMFRPALTAAFAFTVLLLIATCANLAGVMQARLVTRRREVAIRRSLGAGRGRLAGEWLSESFVLALAGGAAGLLGAQFVNAGLASMPLPVELVGDLTLRPTLDWRMVAYAILLSTSTGLLFGVIPAWRAGGVAPMSLLKDEGATVLGGRAGTRLRRTMVVVQVAMSVVLLLASGLLAASLRQQSVFDPGFETTHLGLLRYDLRLQGVANAEWPATMERILDRLRQYPGVTHADIAMTVPLAPGRDRLGFNIPGYTSPSGKSTVSIDINQVGPGYFEALGVPFTRGKPWSPGGPLSLVVNETMARRFWPGLDPVGRTVKMTGAADFLVAGVVQDTAIHSPGEPPLPYIYLPANVEGLSSFFVAVRTNRDPRSMLPDLAQAMLAIDRRLAPSLRMTFEDARATLLFPTRMLAGAVVAFGVIAVLLTAVGLYGVVSTMVGQRTKEIGVRMALGARAVSVLGSVLADALMVAGIGAAIGLVGGYWVAGQLTGWLFRVGQFDVAVYLAVVAVTTCIALFAATIPARRASRVDPVVALRS